MVSYKPSYMDINGKYIRTIRNPFNFTYTCQICILYLYSGAPENCGIVPRIVETDSKRFKALTKIHFN